MHFVVVPPRHARRNRKKSETYVYITFSRMGTSPNHLTILAHVLGQGEICPVACVDEQALLAVFFQIIVEIVLHHLVAHRKRPRVCVTSKRSKQTIQFKIKSN